MFGRRQASAPANNAEVVVPVFTTDPHGAAMFAGITNGTLGHLGNGAVIDARGDAWHGWTKAPQAFKGAGNLGGGRAVIVPGSRLDQEHGLAGDSVQAIFEQRTAARRFG